MNKTHKKPNKSTRFERGWNQFQQLNENSPQQLVEALQDIAPDLATYIIEFAFGDIYSRPGLKLEQRQLVTIAVLVALGDCERQLSLHIKSALNVGLKPNEIVEAIMQCVPFCGVPRSYNALVIAKRIFANS